MSEATPLICANCGEQSTNPGQFVSDGRWVCTESCRKELPSSFEPPDDEPKPMAVASHGPEAPKTHGEAKFFHDGFLAGVTAYAGLVGHSQLKSNNPILAKLLDEQGWKTIETFEKLNEAVLVCEHGVADGEWCEPCNKEVKRARVENAVEHDWCANASCPICSEDFRKQIQ